MLFIYFVFLVSSIDTPPLAIMVIDNEGIAERELID